MMTRLFALCGTSNVGTRRLMNPYRLWRVKFATVASACGRQLRAQPGIRAKKQLKFVEFGELLALWPRCLRTGPRWQPHAHWGPAESLGNVAAWALRPIVAAIHSNTMAASASDHGGLRSDGVKNRVEHCSGAPPSILY
jgi:hypothetical protein